MIDRDTPKVNLGAVRVRAAVAAVASVALVAACADVRFGEGFAVFSGVGDACTRFVTGFTTAGGRSVQLVVAVGVEVVLVPHNVVATTAGGWGPGVCCLARQSCAYNITRPLGIATARAATTTKASAPAVGRGAGCGEFEV